ncbi:SIP domain-containing protein [Aquihabitans sp. G128]|uniref:SIP domain-containing protein n=1 Tax=Aquihabitans sp. G128 TaxID=2849779 RepID=UPI001C2386B6|nr:SIP domain-containing protein [Aquihabitans sp. G128]QXC59151.1 SIP domain-containing protein [Aquihabitans sp. G128]
MAYQPDPDAPWFVVVGDGAALAAVEAVLATLPAGRTVHVVAEVATDAERVDLTSPARLITTWLEGGAGPAGAALEAEVRRLHLPHGDGRIWVAAAPAVAERIREHLVGERGLGAHQVAVAAHGAAPA